MSKTSFMQPVDDRSNPVPILQAKTALAANRYTSLASAQDLTLAPNVRLIRVAAINSGVLMRFASTASTTNFDAVIPAGQIVDYTIRSDAFPTISFIEETASATVVVIQH